jgi:hypothetical protein
LSRGTPAAQEAVPASVYADLRIADPANALHTPGGIVIAPQTRADGDQGADRPLRRRIAMPTPSQAVSVAELKRAIEGRDAAAVTAMYADDAELRIIDHDNPPSRPRDLRGKREIAAYYDDVCGRAMSHRIDPAFATADALSFGQTCTYPDGTKVYCAAMLELHEGKIARQVSVQAWDS